MMYLLVFFLSFVAVEETVATRARANEGVGQCVEKPVLHLPLRIHYGSSGMSPARLSVVVKEINRIWHDQAGIVFDYAMVQHDLPLAAGYDLWFHRWLPSWNGYYMDDHDIHVRDEPELHTAADSAHSAAGRTAAHELGHALHLMHRQDSDENLMRSKTWGYHLGADEILLARQIAAKHPAKVYSNDFFCAPPVFSQILPKKEYN